MATTEINYFVDKNYNYYTNKNGDFYVADIFYFDNQTKLHYMPYKSYFYNHTNEFKKYTAYIRKANGSYIKVKPYIYTNINVAIAGLAIAGTSRVSDSI